MPNILDNMDFEHRLEEMGDNQIELLKFVARQQFAMSQLCPIHDKRIKKLENRGKREIGATSGISAILGAVIVAVIDFLFRRG